MIVKNFVAQRDWDQFHSPKNLAAKLVIESGELLEKFVWLDNLASSQKIAKNRQEIEDEVADVFILLLDFCNVADINLSSATMKKLEEIAAKYPIEKVKSIITKYNKL